MICILHRVHLHLTDLCADSAAGTFLIIYPVSEHRDGIEYRIDRSQRTNIFAERPVDQNRENDGNRQQHIFPCIQPSHRASHGLVEQDKGNPSLQRPGRTDQLTEIRRPLSQDIHQEHRQKDHKYNKYHIFQLPRRLIPPKALDFLKRDTAIHRQIYPSAPQQTSGSLPHKMQA